MAAFLCRSAVRSVGGTCLRSPSAAVKTALPKAMPCGRSPTPIFTRPIIAALGSVDSLMPLHSAIASTRLKSCIAVDASGWGFFYQGLKKGK
ncbi:hypothetical protein ZOSMA_97G00400 [Zostera marina]|uniref:Uncharacterized protein n=1 Tax=Zostera marina TaxID=29655 RepID=A0A0K9NI16_ZOSMR|nr:hypothetical protein ZOSMA_97G00400 [Zostera marina]